MEKFLVIVENDPVQNAASKRVKKQIFLKRRRTPGPGVFLVPATRYNTFVCPPPPSPIKNRPMGEGCDPNLMEKLLVIVEIGPVQNAPSKRVK